MNIFSDWQYSKAMLPDFSENDIKNEPMFFNCDFRFAWTYGGPITRAFLSAIDAPTAKLGVFDSRVHMLMKGWYPCIPGFHHDDVPRTRSDGQPNYISPEYKSEHVMALINGDICPTQFALGKCDLIIPEIGKIIYREWHKEVEALLQTNKLESHFVETNRLLYFNWLSFHQGIKARKQGWRWFGRVSWNTNRKPTNEIRRQVQIYMENPHIGW